MFRRTIVMPFATLALLGLSGQSAPAQDRQVAFRLGPIDVLGQGPSYAEAGLGVFDVFRESDGETSGAGEIQLRWGRKLWFIGPAIGLMGNTDGGVFGYAGIYADLAYGNFVFTPLLGAGGYSESDSKDLGGVFQFRVAGSVAYELQDGTRVGLRVAHISNAGIHDDNPGEEELYVVYALPFP